MPRTEVAPTSHSVSAAILEPRTIAWAETPCFVPLAGGRDAEFSDIAAALGVR